MPRVMKADRTEIEALDQTAAADQPQADAGPPDLHRMRTALQFSQARFAQVFGVPLATLKDLEQGRTRPNRPTEVLLRVIRANPQAVMAVLGTAADMPVPRPAPRPARSGAPSGPPPGVVPADPAQGALTD